MPGLSQKGPVVIFLKVHYDEPEKSPARVGGQFSLKGLLAGLTI